MPSPSPFLLQGVNLMIVDTSDWKPFRISDLFDVVKGTRLTKADMIEGSTRYIGASAKNNGVTASIGNREHIHPANVLTVSYNGSVGEAFYQDKEFWASDDVNVLYPKFDMNRNIGLFITPLIRAVGKRHAFEDKWQLEDMKEDEIRLPVTVDETPDWMFMDSYMQEVVESTDSNLECLLSAIGSTLGGYSR